MPQRVGGVSTTLARILRDSAHEALMMSASAPLPRDGDPAGIAEALAEVTQERPCAWRLLISREDDGPYTLATVRQLLATRVPGILIDLETWDGGQAGPSLVGCTL